MLEDARAGRIRRILAVRFARIGDVLFTTPSLSRLAEALPAARIDYLTTSYGRQVIGRHPAVSDVLVFDRGWILPDYLWRKARLGQDIARRGYDLAVIFESKTATARMLVDLFRRAGIRHVLSRHLAGEGDPGLRALHTCARHQALLAPLGIAPSDAPYTFRYGDEDAAAARALLRRHGIALDEPGRPRLVGIQAGSHYSMLPAWFFWYGRHRHYKNWPFERWSALAARLAREAHARVLITGAGRERAIGQRIADAVDAPPGMEPVNLAGETSLGTLGALLDRLDVLVSVDTGTLHLASALGVPCVALFGPTNPARHGPYRREETTTLLRTGIACSPCSSTVRLRCPLNRCMTELTTQRVFEATVARLERAAGPRAPAAPASVRAQV